MNLQTLFLPLLDVFLKGAVILLAGAASLTLARKASAANRHAIFVAVIGALLLLPVTKLIGPRWSFTVGQASVPMVQVELSEENTAIPKFATEAAAGSQTTAPPAAKAPALPWKGIFVGVWLGGAILLVTRRIYVGFRLRALARSGVPIQSSRLATLIGEMALAHGIRVTARESANCRVPLVAGVLRPVVLLPTSAREWSETELESAVCHEFGHIRRRDSLARLAVDVAQALYWLNPLVWVMAKNMRIAQEQACDDLVLTSGAAPEVYATQLVNVVRSLHVDDLTSRHALAMAQPSTLETRVVAIMDAGRKRNGCSGRGTLAGFGCVVGILAVCAAAQLEGAQGPVSILSERKDSDENAEGKARVMIEAKIIETFGDSANLPEFLRGTKPTNVDVLGEDAIKKLQTAKGLKLVAAPKIITHSGQRAEIRTTQGYNYPADWEKDGSTGAWKAKTTAAEELGLSFEVTPLVEANGVIELTLVSKIVELSDLRDLDDPAKDQNANPARVIPEGHRSQPVFATRKINTTVTLMHGSTVAISGLEHLKKRMVFLLTAKVVSADPKPVVQPNETVELKPAPSNGGAVPADEPVPEKGAAPAKEPAKEASHPKEKRREASAKLPNKKPDAEPEQAPLDINADEFDSSGDVARGRGNVSIVYRDVTMKGDQMSYDPKSRVVTMVGNVRFEDGGKEITAEKLTYRLKDGAVSTEGPSKTKLKNIAVPKKP